MLTLKLTIEEANTLAGIIDVAVKAGGVKIAVPALPFIQKLEAAAQEAAQPRSPSVVIEEED